MGLKKIIADLGRSLGLKLGFIKPKKPKTKTEILHEVQRRHGKNRN